MDEVKSKMAFASLASFVQWSASPEILELNSTEALIVHEHVRKIGGLELFVC